MKYSLIASLEATKYGSKCYFFDRRGQTESLLFVPTQAVSQKLFNVVTAIRLAFPNSEPQSVETLVSLFNNLDEQKSVTTLVSAGYLETIPESHSGNKQQRSSTKEEASAPEKIEAQLHYFRNVSIKHFFKRPVFFNLPGTINDNEVDVGLVGLPVSSVSLSSATTLSPNYLRQQSQKAGFWFDFYRKGIYSEVGCAGSLPRSWCQGVITKDYGDLGPTSRTVGDLFHDIDNFMTSTLAPNGIRGLFVGGDHAVSFPVVNSLLRQHPDLLLVHLDAHNDLFYTDRVEFNHAGPIHGLLLQSGLSKVLSFGLRTTADPRIDPFNALNDILDLRERVEMHSLQATRRLLAAPEDFRQYLQQQTGSAKRPVYLTIDLDVLSDSAMSGRLSTPAGHGLEFSELYELVATVMHETNVIGCDIVEFNMEGSTDREGPDRDITVLMMQLIDGLAAANKRHPLPASANAKAQNE